MHDICDKCDLSYIEHLVEAAPRICGDELLDADELHHPDGHGGLPEGVTLVGVEPALHDQDGDSIEEADQKTTNVTFKYFRSFKNFNLLTITFDCGLRKAGNFLIREAVGVSDEIGQSTYDRI